METALSEVQLQSLLLTELSGPVPQPLAFYQIAELGKIKVGIETSGLWLAVQSETEKAS